MNKCSLNVVSNDVCSDGFTSYNRYVDWLSRPAFSMPNDLGPVVSVLCWEYLICIVGCRVVIDTNDICQMPVIEGY